VNEHRFFNPHQPQTLQSAVILCYIDAVLGLLQMNPITLLISIGLAAGGYGIANEKKWGYTLAVASAILQVVLLLAFFGIGGLNNVSILLAFLFDALLVALLLHRMSREYQRIWFK
jgi:xanthine/uracil permease